MDGFGAVEEHLHRTARYQRGHLHRALLSHVPEDIIHLGKKISSVNANAERGVELAFEDGTSAIADLLIGADGIRSVRASIISLQTIAKTTKGVRACFVPNFPLKWSGWTAFRSVFSTSLIDAIPDLPADSTHWWGPETTFFSSPLGKNQYTIVGGIYVDPASLTSDSKLKSASWDQEADIKLLRDTYTDWNPVVKELTKVTPDIRFYPNLSCSSPLETWVFNERVVLIGDAAHAHGGAHATGGSLAIDDAYTLYVALLSVFPVNSTRKPGILELKRVLELYEEARKPHAERLLAMVHRANEVKLKRFREGRVETDEELRDRARKGTDTNWLHEHDVVKAFDQVLKKNSGDVRL
jgi:salicylate hydroxylase